MIVLGSRIAHRSRPKPGEHDNGDAAFVRELEDGELIAVVDGLGHGGAAAEAAQLACASLRAATDLDVRALIEGADRALRGTRGAALTLIVRHGMKLAAAGVGNVALRYRGAIALPFATTPGIVGNGVRKLRVATGDVAAGARVVLHSDGVDARFEFGDLSPSVDGAASDLLLRALAHDDATALVADYAA